MASYMIPELSPHYSHRTEDGMHGAMHAGSGRQYLVAFSLSVSVRASKDASAMSAARRSVSRESWGEQG